MKIIHFVTGLGDDEFGICERIAIRSAKEFHPEWKVWVWCGKEPDSDQWMTLRDTTDIEVKKAKNHRTWHGNKIPQYAHRADLVRHPVLYEHGGLYMDTDTITVGRFPDSWLTHDTVIGREFCKDHTVGLCNAVMYSKKGSTFQKLWLKEWRKFDGTGWNELSVQLPWKMHQENPGLCFPVDWKMLGPIHCEPSPFITLGPIKDCIVVHLWRTYWRKTMEYITEDYILNCNTTYCYHARQHL